MLVIEKSINEVISRFSPEERKLIVGNALNRNSNMIVRSLWTKYMSLMRTFNVVNYGNSEVRTKFLVMLFRDEKVAFSDALIESCKDLRIPVHASDVHHNSPFQPLTEEAVMPLFVDHKYAATEEVTRVFGKDLKDMTEAQTIEAIRDINKEIENLQDLVGQSKKMGQRVASMKEALTVLYIHLDEVAQ